MNRSELIAAIPKGKENALHLRDLAARFDVTERAFKAAVSKARCEGEAILSGHNGYFLPESSEDLRAFVDTWKKRIKTEYITTAAIRAAAAAEEKQ